MKKKDKIDEVLLKEMFSKFRNTSPETIGVEIEIPIVSMNGKDIEMSNIQKLFILFVNQYNFEIIKRDNDGNIIVIKNVDSNDKLSLEYSKNTIEFSLKEDLNIFNIKNRMDKYIELTQNFIKQFNYILVGKGINPNYKYIDKKCLNDDRYLMIEKILTKSNGKSELFNQFCAYICSIQTHLTPTKEELVNVINVFSGLEWIKSILFANSFMKETNSRLSRDFLWENSNFGIENTGTNRFYKNLDECIDDYKQRKIHYIERNNKFYSIIPRKLNEILIEDNLLCEDIEGKKSIFKSSINDFNTFRSYKNVEVTRRGTIEIRSDCMQDIDNLFEIVAFNVGVYKKYQEIYNLLDEKKYFKKSIQLRKAKNRNDSINKEEHDLIDKIVNTVYNGLYERKYGEEKLLKILEERRFNNEESRALVL